MANLCSYALFVAMLIASAACQESSDAQNTTKTTNATAGASSSAREFCSSPAIKQVSCGWASDTEQQQALAGQSPFGGTVWAGESVLSPLPAKVEEQRSYFQFAGHIISLGCQPGKLRIRSVFRVLPESTGCTRLLMPDEGPGSLASSVSATTRCQLTLASGGAPADAAAAAAAGTVGRNCTTCSTCADCEEMQKAGVWYSDTATLQWGGCAAILAQPEKAYEPTIPSVLLNPGAAFELADFRVQQA